MSRRKPVSQHARGKVLRVYCHHRKLGEAAPPMRLIDRRWVHVERLDTATAGEWIDNDGVTHPMPQSALWLAEGADDPTQQLVRQGRGREQVMRERKQWLCRTCGTDVQLRHNRVDDLAREAVRQGVSVIDLESLAASLGRQ